MSTELTPEQLRAILTRLDEVEKDARELRETIQRRLMESRLGDAQDRTGQPRPRRPRSSR